MGRRALSAVLFHLTMILPGLALAATLEVNVSGLTSDNGDVHVALYDNPETFPKSGGMLTETQVVPEGRTALALFKDLKPGRYAVAVYHDENGNHAFDQGFLGIPLEDYGFSNDAVVFLGPPGFSDAAFEVIEPVTSIKIHLGL